MQGLGLQHPGTRVRSALEPPPASWRRSLVWCSFDRKDFNCRETQYFDGISGAKRFRVFTGCKLSIYIALTFSLTYFARDFWFLARCPASRAAFRSLKFLGVISMTSSSPI
jgi:hypothetical protein